MLWRNYISYKIKLKFHADYGTLYGYSLLHVVSPLWYMDDEWYMYTGCNYFQFILIHYIYYVALSFIS